MNGSTTSPQSYQSRTYSLVITFVMRWLVLLPIMAQAVVSSLQDRPSAVQVEEQSPGLHRRGAYTTYVAWASDPKNQTQLQETRKFLNETVLNDASPITIFQPLSGNSFLWGGITLDDAALKKVQAYPAIKAVKLSPDFKDFLAVPLVEKRQGIFDILKNLRRPLNWERQSPASKNLALISQPKYVAQHYPFTVLHLTTMFVYRDTMELFYPDFVYDAKAGEGAWIYIVDNGVKFDVQSVCSHDCTRSMRLNTSCRIPASGSSQATRSSPCQMVASTTRETTITRTLMEQAWFHWPWGASLASLKVQL